MEPPKGFWASLWNFICFLPYFIGLLLLGNIKGAILCPLICLIMTVGNSTIIIGLWPVHFVWTYYSVVRAKLLGPILKLVLCICILPVLLILWPVVGIAASIVGGAAYGFLSPIFATFDAVGGGKTNEFFHCIYDGTWSTIKGSFTVVRDFTDLCVHSYFSYMDDLRPPDGKYYEIRLCYLPYAVIDGLLGVIVDVPVISLVALFKGPYMFFKGWLRLFHDLIGREGPFLETICVPFAGLAILLWPLAVVGAVLASMLASFFLGAYAGVVAYQEASFLFGLHYIIAALSIYDEYSNDVLDMPEVFHFPRPQYRKKAESSEEPSVTPSLTRLDSYKKPPHRTSSIKNVIPELKPLELLRELFKECHHTAEKLLSEGLITEQDVEDAKSSRVITVGLPTYCILKSLLCSEKEQSLGILLGDDTELNRTDTPMDKFFKWFHNPLLVIKEQIKAKNLSASEEDYLCKLVLLGGDPERLKKSITGSPPESERKRAELDALARRLQGIMKSMSRFPTFKRQFDDLVDTLSDELAKKNGKQKTKRSKSTLLRIVSWKSFKGRTTNGPDQESVRVTRDVEISNGSDEESVRVMRDVENS